MSYALNQLYVLHFIRKINDFLDKLVNFEKKDRKLNFRFIYLDTVGNV